MPINQAIAGGIQPVQIPNQLANYAQFAQLQKYTQDIDNETKLNDAYANSLSPTGEVDPTLLRQNLIGAKLGSKLPAVEKTLLDARKAKADVGKSELELGIAQADNSIRQIASYNTRDDALKHIQADFEAKKITQQQAQQFAGMLPPDDSGMPQFQLQMLRKALSAKDQLEQHFVTRDKGGSGDVVAVSKYAGGGPAQVVPGSQFTKTATVADQLAERKFAWEKAHPGYELKENEDGSVYGVNKDTLQAVPVTIGGVAPTNTSPRVPTAAVTPAVVQTIPGMNSVLDKPPTAPAAPATGTPFKGKGTALTESQGNATGFGMRAFESNRLLNDLEKGGTVSGGRIKGLVEGTLNALVPYQGEKLAAGAGNVMNVLPGVLGGPNDQQQQYQQAKMNFITAVLRKESGASIAPAEFETEDKKYFPQPGESDKVLAQKQKAREMAVEALKIMAGPGAKNIGAGGGMGGGASATNPLGLPGR
jgi:hypothetical protein